MYENVVLVDVKILQNVNQKQGLSDNYYFVEVFGYNLINAKYEVLT